MNNFSNEAYYLFFSTLANRTNLIIIDSLREKRKSVLEISKSVNQNKAVVASQLDQLEHCALILSEKAGQEKYYYLNLEVLEPLSEILEFHTSKYCPGLTQCMPPDKLKDYLKKEAEKETYVEH
jgi:DNA-binding transcriptional ArsR family regulator